MGLGHHYSALLALHGQLVPGFSAPTLPRIIAISLSRSKFQLAFFQNLWPFHAGKSLGGRRQRHYRTLEDSYAHFEQFVAD